jgi:hypothetical protein
MGPAKMGSPQPYRYVQLSGFTIYYASARNPAQILYLYLTW